MKSLHCLKFRGKWESQQEACVLHVKQIVLCERTGSEQCALSPLMTSVGKKWLVLLLNAEVQLYLYLSYTLKKIFFLVLRQVCKLLISAFSSLLFFVRLAHPFLFTLLGIFPRNV